MLYFVLLIGIVIIWVVGYMVMSRAEKRGSLSRAFNLALYTVLLPPETTQTEDKEKKSLKELVGIMEQLYAGMTSVKSEDQGFWKGKLSFALEIALPEVGEEVMFYAAVPRHLSRVFEKKVNALFPHAKIERTKDYNIFNSEGVVRGSVLKLARAPFFPLRTYKHLEADPLNVIASAFSKLKKEGEGAALQIVLAPAGSEWQGRGRDAARMLRKGKRPEEVAKAESGAWFTATKEALGVLATGGANSKKQEQNKKDEERRDPFDEEFVKLVEEKASRVGFDTNIRLIASASTEEEAEDILQGLEDAFLQFTEPQGNGFMARRLTGRALEELVYHFSFRLFDKHSSLYATTDELSSLYHFPVGDIAHKVKFLKSREAPAPANLPLEGMVLGENRFHGEEATIRITRDDRRRHLYIIGQTGTGKSNLLKNMIYQDIMNGEGVCFIDPHGELAEEILELIPRERADDVVYFNPGDIERPLGLNMLEYDPRYPEQKTFVVNELFNIFQKLYGAVPESMGPMFEQYFRNATLLVLDDPASGNTLLEIGRVLADKQFRDYKLSKSTNVVVHTFWRDVAEKAGGEAALQNIVPYITSKFDIFLANEIMRPIIAQEASAFNFREVMDKKKILLVNLSKGRLGDINSNLLGLIVVGKLLMAALSRVDMLQEDRKDFYLYIDEFQNVTTKSIATILSEARKYRLNLIVAHQFIGQLEEDVKKAVFGNVGSMASFRIGVEDAEFMKQEFEPVFTEHDLINIDNYNAYLKLLIKGQTSRPFNIRTLRAPEGSREVANAIKQVSALKYGRPRNEVEAEILRRYTYKAPQA